MRFTIFPGSIEYTNTKGRTIHFRKNRANLHTMYQLVDYYQLTKQSWHDRIIYTEYYA